MFIISWTIDVISGIGDVGSPETGPGVTYEKTKDFLWPPQVVIAQTLWWCEQFDPVFCYNPVWMKLMAGVSPFIYSPFYIAAIYAFIQGKEWIREVGLMYAWGLFYTLSIILAEEYAGPVPSYNYPVVFAANAPYWVFPLFLIWRLWPKHPFTTKVTTTTATRLHEDKKKMT